MLKEMNIYRYYKDYYKGYDGACDNTSDFYMEGVEFESRQDHRQPEPLFCGLSQSLQANDWKMNSVTSNH
jgi:hypothetical protein